MVCHHTTMTKPPESVHDRLNRELMRYYFGGWKLWLTVLLVLAALVFLYFPQPMTVTYQSGVVTGATTLLSEDGPRIRLGVQTNGIRVEAGTRARLSTPANGETVCLRRTVRAWTGAETFNLAPIQLCNGSNPTPAVD